MNRRKRQAAPRTPSPADERKVLQEFKAAKRTARSRGARHELLDSISALWEMLTDPRHSIPASTWAWIVLALVYFIVPMDAIPDPVPGIGYLDDAAVVGWVVSVIAEDIEAYRRAKGES